MTYDVDLSDILAVTFEDHLDDLTCVNCDEVSPDGFDTGFGWMCPPCDKAFDEHYDAPADECGEDCDLMFGEIDDWNNGVPDAMLDYLA